jgi:hypothetical protein
MTLSRRRVSSRTPGRPALRTRAARAARLDGQHGPERRHGSQSGTRGLNPGATSTQKEALTVARLPQARTTGRLRAGYGLAPGSCSGSTRSRSGSQRLGSPVATKQNPRRARLARISRARIERTRSSSTGRADDCLWRSAGQPRDRGNGRVLSSAPTDDRPGCRADELGRGRQPRVRRNAGIEAVSGKRPSPLLAP